MNDNQHTTRSNPVDNSEAPWKPQGQATEVIGTKPVTRPPRKLTRKQEAFIKHLIDNPKDSATKAVLATYGKPDKPVTYDSASQIATDNLRKPPIMAELAKYSNKAEMALIEALGADKKNYKFNPETKVYELLDIDPDHTIRLRAADSLLDRVHGKATQKIEQTTTTVTLSLDLTEVVANNKDN